MSAVDQIIEKARATVWEFEAHAEKHKALIERSLDLEYVNLSWWLASLTDEEDRALSRYAHLQIKARAARKTLEFWSKEV